jgi:hypothetical protein
VPAELDYVGVLGGSDLQGQILAGWGVADRGGDGIGAGFSDSLFDRE